MTITNWKEISLKLAEEILLNNQTIDGTVNSCAFCGDSWDEHDSGCVTHLAKKIIEGKENET